MKKFNREPTPEQVFTISRRALLIGSVAAGLLRAADGFSNKPSEQGGADDIDAEISQARRHAMEYAADTDWKIDFSRIPDGPLAEASWNFVTGTKVSSIHDEAEAYSSRRKNVRVENGELVIEAHHERYDDRGFSSGRIDTLGIASFRYGTLEFDAQLPRGVGTWPAAWLMPDNPRYNPDDYGVGKHDPNRWAMNGEIDVLEAIGRIENQNIPAAHSVGEMRTGTIYTPAMIDDAYTKFHRYGLIKKPGHLIFTLDGKPYAERKRQPGDTAIEWPYDQSYYMIINLAMGGTWAGAEKTTYPPYGIDTRTKSSWQFKLRNITARKTT